MKTRKTSIAFSIFAYLFAAFVKNQANPAAWAWEDRFVLALALFVCFTFFAFAEPIEKALK